MIVPFIYNFSRSPECKKYTDFVIMNDDMGAAQGHCCTLFTKLKSLSVKVRIYFLETEARSYTDSRTYRICAIQSVWYQWYVLYFYMHNFLPVGWCNLGLIWCADGKFLPNEKAHVILQYKTVVPSSDIGRSVQWSYYISKHVVMQDVTMMIWLEMWLDHSSNTIVGFGFWTKFYSTLYLSSPCIASRLL